MPKEFTHKNDKHYRITVSDKQSTRHFLVPRLIKPLLIGIGLTLTLALISSNIMLFSQHDKLAITKTQTESLEDAFVKLSTKNSTLSQSLKREYDKQELISLVLTQMEEISGVSSSFGSEILERITAVADYFATKELDIDELYGRVDSTEESIGPNTEQSEDKDTALEERIEPASLNISQQKIIHDSIPNGYPTANDGITSAFGKRIHPTSNQSSFHNGVDLKATQGTEVYATADGIIKTADHNNLSGKRVVVTHNLGFETRYAHLAEMRVTPGEVVQKGDIIGLSGNTGRSEGPHLHYEIRYLDKPHNPVDFINWEFGNQEIFTNVRGIQWQSLISLINKQISRPTLQLSQAVL